MDSADWMAPSNAFEGRSRSLLFDKTTSGYGTPTHDTEHELEPALVLAPPLVEKVYKELIAASCVPRFWHKEGRYGIRVRAIGDGGASDHRSIPILPAAAHRIQSFLDAFAQVDAMDETGAGLPSLLQDVLRSKEASLTLIPKAQPRIPKAEERDNTVHPERLPKTMSALTPPEKDAFTFCELFAGIGGFRVGLEALGGRCVFASEIASESAAVYNLNHEGQDHLAGDIYQVTDADIPPHDILVGGFPCQPFSSLGLQPGLADAKGVLFTEIVRVLHARHPQAFLLENVPGLLHCDEQRVLTEIVKALEEAGYHVWHEVIDARCLLPQSRKRLYLVGLRKGEGCDAVDAFHFPYIPDLRLRAGDILQPEKELEVAGEAEQYTLVDDQFAQLQVSKLWKPNKLAWDDKVCDTLVSHYSVSVGKGTSQLVPRSAPHHPRRFTPRECARLMGFPESFKLPERAQGQGVNAWFKSLYRMFGNAVCPPVVAALAGAVLDHCPDIAGYSRHENWESLGRNTAVQLALDALAPHRRETTLCKLSTRGLLPSGQAI